MNKAGRLPAAVPAPDPSPEDLNKTSRRNANITPGQAADKKSPLAFNEEA